MPFKKLYIFLLKGAPAVMGFLIGNVAFDRRTLRGADGESPITLLP